MDCPMCGTRDVGRIGRERFYCRTCYHEWTEKSGEVKIFRIASDGTVVRLKGEKRGLRVRLATGCL